MKNIELKFSFSSYCPFKKCLFSRRTACGALFTPILLLKNWVFELGGSTIKNGK
jgi:hypothetical protein